MELKFCPECGAQLLTQKFCQRCGANISKYLNAESSQRSSESLSGFDFSALENEASKQLREQERLEKIKKAFEIENGVLKKYIGEGDDVIIPREVSSIGPGAFAEYQNLKSLRFEDNSCLTSINENAFPWSLNELDIHITDLDAWYRTSGCIYYNKKLFLNETPITCLNIPNGITHIGKWFNRYNGITSITIPDSITHIPDFAFSSCSDLTSINIPNSVTSIGVGVFEGCAKLTGITLPYTVTTIGDSAFEGCYNLTSIKLPNTLTSIGNRAFARSNLASITIPGNIASIDVQTFMGCENLRSVTIQNGVKMIPSQMFDGCINLTNITIPSSVTSIYHNAFINCSNLTQVTLEENCQLTYDEVRNAFSSKTKFLRVPAKLAESFRQRKGMFDKFEIIAY